MANKTEIEKKIWRLSLLMRKISELHQSCCYVCNGKILPEYEIDITLLDELQQPIERELNKLIKQLNP